MPMFFLIISHACSIEVSLSSTLVWIQLAIMKLCIHIIPGTIDYLVKPSVNDEISNLLFQIHMTVITDHNLTYTHKPQYIFFLRIHWYKGTLDDKCWHILKTFAVQPVCAGKYNILLKLPNTGSSYSDLFINSPFFSDLGTQRKLTGLLNIGIISTCLEINICRYHCNFIVFFVLQDDPDGVPFSKKSGHVMRDFHLKFWVSWNNLSSCKWPHIIKVWHVLWWLPVKYYAMYSMNM